MPEFAATIRRDIARDFAATIRRNIAQELAAAIRRNTTQELAAIMDEGCGSGAGWLFLSNAPKIPLDRSPANPDAGSDPASSEVLCCREWAR